ncbi:MAG TPA: hypothetical protein VF790_10875 [Dissulfurispiraceae bacterium]
MDAGYIEIVRPGIFELEDMLHLLTLFYRSEIESFIRETERWLCVREHRKEERHNQWENYSFHE